jgi:hypothetical protein
MLSGVSPLDADPQCESEGNFNVAQELQYEILSGRYVIGKGKLNETEETAIAALASAVAAVPESAPTFAEGHATNVRNMMHPAWTPIVRKPCCFWPSWIRELRRIRRTLNSTELAGAFGRQPAKSGGTGPQNRRRKAVCTLDCDSEIIGSAFCLLDHANGYTHRA